MGPLNGPDAFVDQQRLFEVADLGVELIFDVGAHHGETAERYLERFPDARLVSFEPFPASFAQLEARLADEPRAHCEPCALAATAQSRAFYSNSATPTNSLFRLDPNEAFTDAPVDELGEVAVETVALDAYCADRGIDHINILKMDVQCAELEVFAGAEAMLARGAIDAIYTEITWVPVYVGQPQGHEVFAALARHGYQMFQLYNDRLSEHGRLKWQDGLFLSPQLRARTRV